MGNPFIMTSKTYPYNEYLTSLCSINKVVIAKPPVSGIDDEIQGKTANEIFSANLISREIKDNAEKLCIDLSSENESSLPKYLDYCLESDNPLVKKTAESIAKKFGYRLGTVLLTLKKGEYENRLAREDWNSSHWDYWKNVKNVILLGGLANGTLGKSLTKYALELFRISGNEAYNLRIYENSSLAGIMGCATQIKNKYNTTILLDLGQTKIKRCAVKYLSSEAFDCNVMNSVPSRYMDTNNTDSDIAKKLHRYILDVITDTWEQAKSLGELNNEIIISIASYTVNGRLDNKRGGYAKLTAIADNYAECLTEEISAIFRKEVSIKLIHDGTAIALNFSNIPDSVCLSLGTAFGVGFPEIKI